MDKNEMDSTLDEDMRAINALMEKFIKEHEYEVCDALRTARNAIYDCRCRQWARRVLDNAAKSTHEDSDNRPQTQ